MGGLVIVGFLYIAGLVIGAFVSNPDLDYHAEEKTASYYKGLHFIAGILFVLVFLLELS